MLRSVAGDVAGDVLAAIGLKPSLEVLNVG